MMTNKTYELMFNEINDEIKEVKQEVNNKVDKISGKGLSANDFTDPLKNNLDGMISGTVIVKKAEQDANGDVIADTYETKIDATNKLATKVDKTQKIIGIDLQDDILLTEFKTALGNATQSVAGLLSAEDKTHLDGLVALLESSDGNTVVDTIGEILAIFNNYPEGADLVTALNGKVDKVEGKGLSTNDYTNTDKQSVEKISTIEQDILDLESDKVDKNNAITAGTHTKITYDAKGLVTGGSDLVPSDIGAVEEALNDGKTYARKNKSWVEFQRGFLPDEDTIVLNEDDELEATNVVIWGYE